MEHIQQATCLITRNTQVGQASPNPSYKENINSVTGNQDVVVKDENNNTIATYQLSLGDIELNAIGNYKDELIYDVDEDKVYKNEVIGEITLSSESNWSKRPITELDRFGYGVNLGGKPTEGGFCNYFKVFKGNTSNSIGYISNNANTQILVNFSEYGTTTLEQFISWLSTHVVEFAYVKNNPTLTEITDTTLKAQIKALYNAHSNTGTTIITSNGNLPMVIKVRALKGE